MIEKLEDSTFKKILRRVRVHSEESDLIQKHLGVGLNHIIVRIAPKTSAIYQKERSKQEYRLPSDKSRKL